MFSKKRRKEKETHWNAKPADETKHLAGYSPSLREEKMEAPEERAESNSEERDDETHDERAEGNSEERDDEIQEVRAEGNSVERDDETSDKRAEDASEERADGNSVERADETQDKRAEGNSDERADETSDEREKSNINPKKEQNDGKEPNEPNESDEPEPDSADEPIDEDSEPAAQVDDAAELSETSSLEDGEVGEETGEQGECRRTREEGDTGAVMAEALEKAYCLGAGIDSESLAKAKKRLAEIAGALSEKAFNPELIHLALKLDNIDRLIEEARQEGLRQGRGERIEEAFRDKRKRARQAAAIPHFNGTANPESPLGPDSIFNVARNGW